MRLIHRLWKHDGCVKLHFRRSRLQSLATTHFQINLKHHLDDDVMRDLVEVKPRGPDGYAATHCEYRGDWKHLKAGGQITVPYPTILNHLFVGSLGKDLYNENLDKSWLRL